MEKKTKILYLITAAVVLLVVVMTFCKIFILHDYLISYQVPCDPKMESCFLVECDQETGEGCDISDSEKYYKLIEKKAYNSIRCKTNDFACMLCQKDEASCTTTLCDSSNEENICSSIINEQF